MSFSDRIPLTTSSLAKRLLKLMLHKESNLAISADVTTAKELLLLAAQLGPEICMLKTHIDIIEDFTPELTRQLRQIADEHQFLIFEDRKFADIGNTVKHQFAGGIYQIASWADIVNAHSLPGPGIIEGLIAAGKDECGLILLAEMSSSGHLMSEQYQQQTLEMAKKFANNVFGFITQHAISNDPKWINLTPGIKLNSGTDSLGQQYTTPEKAILQQGSDVVIVGRGIIAAKDRLNIARQYKQAAWRAYLKSL